MKAPAVTGSRTVRPLWLSGRALVDQGRCILGSVKFLYCAKPGVLGSTLGDCQPFHFPLFSPHNIYIALLCLVLAASNHRVFLKTNAIHCIECMDVQRHTNTNCLLHLTVQVLCPWFRRYRHTKLPMRTDQ